MSSVQNSTSTFALFPRGGGFTRPQYLRLAQNGICTEYAPHRFHAIVMRVRSRTSSPSSHATALLFSSGRVVMTGVRVQHSSQIQSALRRSAHRVCRRVRASLQAGGLSRLAQTVGVRQLTLRNLVACVQASDRLMLERMADQLRCWQQRHQHPMSVPLMSGTHFCQVTFCLLDLCSFPGLRCTLALRCPAGGERDDDVCGAAEAALVHITFLLFRNGRIIITGAQSVRALETASNDIRTLVTRFTV